MGAFWKDKFKALSVLKLGEHMELRSKIENLFSRFLSYFSILSVYIEPGKSSCLPNIASCLPCEKISQKIMSRLQQDGASKELFCFRRR